MKYFSFSFILTHIMGLHFRDTVSNYPSSLVLVLWQHFRNSVYHIIYYHVLFSSIYFHCKCFILSTVIRFDICGGGGFWQITDSISFCSSHNAIVWLQKTWNTFHKSYGLLLRYFNVIFWEERIFEFNLSSSKHLLSIFHRRNPS